MSEASYVYIRVKPLSEFGASAGVGPGLPVVLELPAGDYDLADLSLPTAIDLTFEFYGAGGGGAGSPVGASPGGGGGGSGAYVKFVKKISDMGGALHTIDVGAAGPHGGAAADGTQGGFVHLKVDDDSKVSVEGGMGGVSTGGVGGAGGAVVNDGSWDLLTSTDGQAGDTTAASHGAHGANAVGGRGGSGGTGTSGAGHVGTGYSSGGGGGAATVGIGGDGAPAHARITFFPV